MWSAWPLASVGSLGYVAGQLQRVVACAQMIGEIFAKTGPATSFFPNIAVLPGH